MLPSAETATNFLKIRSVCGSRHTRRSGRCPWHRGASRSPECEGRERRSPVAASTLARRPLSPSGRRSSRWSSSVRRRSRGGHVRPNSNTVCVNSCMYRTTILAPSIAPCGDLAQIIPGLGQTTFSEDLEKLQEPIGSRIHVGDPRRLAFIADLETFTSLHEDVEKHASLLTPGTSHKPNHPNSSTRTVPCLQRQERPLVQRQGCARERSSVGLQCDLRLSCR